MDEFHLQNLFADEFSREKVEEVATVEQDGGMMTAKLTAMAGVLELQTMGQEQDEQF